MCICLQKCEKLTMMILCNILSGPFHEPVSPLVSSKQDHKNVEINANVCYRIAYNMLIYFTVELLKLYIYVQIFLHVFFFEDKNRHKKQHFGILAHHRKLFLRSLM